MAEIQRLSAFRDPRLKERGSSSNILKAGAVPREIGLGIWIEDFNG
jgi:hypothetical protein